MRNRECPACDNVNAPHAVVDGVQEYRCGSCGLVYYGPCGCDTSHDQSGPATEPAAAEVVQPAALHGDWEMTTPPSDARGGSGVKNYPGC